MEDVVVTMSLPVSALGAPGGGDLRQYYEGAVEATSVAVEPTSEGFRAMTVVNGPSAPERFRFHLARSVDSLRLEEDGSVSALDADDRVIGSIESPWARDVAGASVPTHYEVDGTVLTQVVQHREKDYAYPIVADPSWVWWTKNIGVCVAEVASIVVPGKAAQVAAKLAKAAKGSKKARQAKKAIDEAGGLVKAVKLIATYAKNRGKKMSKVDKLRVKRILSSGSGIVVDILGLGGCWAIYKKLR